MSLDPTLKSRNSLAGRRSVLSRTERIEKLVEEGKFDPEEASPFGLPKVRTIVANIGGKSKAKAEDEQEAVEGAEAPAEE